MKLFIGNEARSCRGSVLVPVVAAVTILSLAGIVLSQTFSAQRLQSTLVVESSRAFWTAEAGAWHAARTGVKLSPAIDFDRGSYVIEEVEGTSNEFVGVGALGSSTRRVDVPGPLYLESGTDGGQLLTAPLDEGASNASARRLITRRFAVDLVSTRSYPAVLSSIGFRTSDGSQYVDVVEYDGNRIWSANGQVNRGAAELDLSDADPMDRVLDANSSASLEVRVQPRPAGTDSYFLELRFTDGTINQLSFPIRW